MVSLRTSQQLSVCVLCLFTSFDDAKVILAALYFVGGVRVTFSTGIAAGGNLAYWQELKPPYFS